MAQYTFKFTTMWAMIFSLLIVVSSRSDDPRTRMDSHAVSSVLSLRSGGRDSILTNSTMRTDGNVAIRPANATNTVVTWSIPRNAGRKGASRGRRKRSKSASERPRAHITNAKGTVSPLAPGSRTIALLIGAIVASGCTLGLGSQAAEASPFDPRPPPKSRRQPFFEGWFIRLVDHEQRLSFAVILGSFRSRGGTELDQHYVSLSYLHEPKGGLLPAEADNAEEPAELPKEKDKDGREETGDKGSSEGASVPGNRFLEWARDQRLKVLRGFGMEGGSDAMVPSRKGMGRKLDTGNVGQRGAAQTKAPRDESPSARREAIVEVDADIECATDEAKYSSDTVGQAASLLESGRDADVERGERHKKQRIGRRGWEYLRFERGVDVIEGPHAPTTLSRQAAADDRNFGEMEDRSVHGVTIMDMATATGTDIVDNDAGRPSGGTMHARGDSLGQTSFPSHATTEVKGDTNGAPRNPNEDPITSRSRADATERTHTFHAFPPPETVTISRHGQPVVRMPNLRDDSSFTWEADGIGHFTVDGDTGHLSFQLPELSVAASFRNRSPWSRKRPNSAGPEGWLTRTGLLPLHYFVHSLGSEAGYSLHTADAPRAVVGRGSLHMESNYGTSFPAGWIWAQGCSSTQGLCGRAFRDGEVVHDDGKDDSRGVGSDADQKAKLLEEGDVKGSPCTERAAQFVLTGGRFVIGPVTTKSFVMAFRSKRHHWDFRTTDLDRISVDVCRRESRVKIVARSWGDERVLEADIHAPEGSFGSAIYVPTPEGFSNAPGCIESYAATATFRLYTKGREGEGCVAHRFLVLREEVDFKLAALEFGGSYQDT